MWYVSEVPSGCHRQAVITFREAVQFLFAENWDRRGNFGFLRSSRDETAAIWMGYRPDIS
jgi:hypothetical protein